MERRALEREADRLGIPWTTETSDDALQVLIHTRDEEPPATPPTTVMPACYGLLWEGPHNNDCRGCSVKDSCLHRFSTEHIPMVRREMGETATLEEVSGRMKVSPQAIIDAMKYSRNLPLPEEPLTPKPVAPHESADISKAFDTGETDEPIVTVTQAEVFGETPEEPEEKSVDQQELPAAPPEVPDKAPEAKPEPAAKKKEKVKAPAKPVAEKPKKKKATAKAKATAKVKAKAVSNPPPTGSAQRASGPVVTTQLSTASVKRATALASQTRQWGESEKRWQRERDRSPGIAALARGSTITREYKGETHLVKVLKGRYRNEGTGEEFPTLYAVTKAITGLYERQSSGKSKSGQRKLSNWSATKFWRVAINLALYGKPNRLPPKHPEQKYYKRKQRAAKRKAKAKRKAEPKS